MSRSNLEKAFQFDPQEDRNYLFEQRALKNRCTTIRQLALEADAADVSPQKFNELMTSMGKQLFTALVNQAELDHGDKSLRLCPSCNMTELKRSQHECEHCAGVSAFQSGGMLPYERMTR